MSIERALYEFIKNPFSGDTSQAARNTAREYVSDQVGTRIYLDRRPQSELDPAITIRTVQVFAFQDLPGEPGCIRSLVDITVWGQYGGLAPIESVELAKNYLHPALAHYRGSMGSLYVQGVSLEGANMLPAYAPIDASDRWTFAYSLTFEIMHQQAVIEAV